eukprot:3608187-Rhodomonas_salina.2
MCIRDRAQAQAQVHAARDAPLALPTRRYGQALASDLPDLCVAILLEQIQVRPDGACSPTHFSITPQNQLCLNTFQRHNFQRQHQKQLLLQLGARLRTGKEHLVLGDDRKLHSEVIKSYFAHIDAIKLDGALPDFANAEEHNGQRRLPCPGHEGN